MNNPQKEFIGQTYEDMLIVMLEGQEYIGCNFLRCDVLLPRGSSVKIYDSEFTDCKIVFPKDCEAPE